MGQYYQPTNLRTLEYVYSHDFNNGLKLMEHSYIGNNFVRAVESLLTPGGPWYKDRIEWAGDYADGGKPGEDDNNTYHMVSWVEYETGRKRTVPTRRISRRSRFIVNHTKNLYVDKSKSSTEEGWGIHPLPLLTCKGNGRGGGDYHGTDQHLVGTWAGDSISIETKPPPEYEELITNFKEY